MNIKKILAGIDFGKDTERVLTYALYSAKAYEASVSLLYIIDYLVTPPSYLAQYIDEEKKAAERKFEPMKKQMKEAGIVTRTDVIVGRLRESFAAAAKNTGADMLILGFMSHVFRRSSSEKLIKGLRIPMLVVRGEKAASAKFGSVKVRKVLCPTDFSGPSGKAVECAKALSAKVSAEMHILHVSSHHLLKKMRVSEERDRSINDLKETAQKQLSKFLVSHDIAGEGVLEEGDPEKRIVAFAEDRDIDLIVMGARGLGLMQGMLVGSVTDAVLKASPCPVLVIHE